MNGGVAHRTAGRRHESSAQLGQEERTSKYTASLIVSLIELELSELNADLK